jgi:hypothetical protein
VFRKNDGQQNFFHALELSRSKLKKLQSSWATFFHDIVLPILIRIESQFEDLFAKFGRPNFPISVMLGILILKHEMDLTDEAAVEQFNFNITWHSALGVSSYDANVCRKTIHNFQVKMMASGKHEILFNEITDEIIKQAGIKLNQQRLDSVHIKSNMMYLGRVRLFSRTVEIFLKELKKKRPSQFEMISEKMKSDYMDREGYFCDPKPSEAKGKAIEIAGDIHVLVEGFAADEEVTCLRGYRLLKRLFKEQCEVKGSNLQMRTPESSSLQNPSDPDASYSGHKGKGYQAQVTESCGDGNAFQVVTSVDVEGAHESDQHAMPQVIERLEEKDRKPEELQADTAYGSDENVEEAKRQGVEVISPVSGKEPSEDKLEGFEIDETSGRINSCPNGQKPEYQRERKSRGVTVAEFDPAQCDGCPFYKECPCKTLKNGKRRIHIHHKVARLAKRRAHQKTKEFKEKYKKRSGIEATFSQLKNTHGGGRLRVRGMPAVKFVTFLKFTAINVHRYIKSFMNQPEIRDDIQSAALNPAV